METARSFGNYDLALALADIVDNSITAGASAIDIDANYEKNEIRISDNGSGMTEPDLIRAMRIGSKNPRDERAPNDLGRFGLGMKTASFSQADKLIVLSNCDQKLSGAAWDLNDCAEFKMKIFDEDETFDLAQSNITQGNGTEVIWSQLNRMKQGSKKTEMEGDFNRDVTTAIEELGLIFHRFLQKHEARGQYIEINMNGRPIKARDPFCRSNQGTQKPKPTSETIGGETIKFTPFILPYYSNLSATERQQLGGKEGFVKNSGFYIYRQKRLIIKGTWFKLIPHGEFSKLARIMVDVPNSLDEQWKITVDKSGAQLPPALRGRLSQWLDNRIVSRSKKVFKHKADKEQSLKVRALWSLTTNGGVQQFEIDKQHPILQKFEDQLERSLKSKFGQIVTLIQKCLPIHNIYSTMSDEKDNIIQGYVELPQEILDMATEIASKMLDAGKKKEEIIGHLSLMQPFSNFPTEVSKHLEQQNIFRA